MRGMKYLLEDLLEDVNDEMLGTKTRQRTWHSVVDMYRGLNTSICHVGHHSGLEGSLDLQRATVLS